MMKGVCTQCLCKHVDPHTVEEYFVYSCYKQDQDLGRVDFPNLKCTTQTKYSTGEIIQYVASLFARITDLNQFTPCPVHIFL